MQQMQLVREKKTAYFVQHLQEEDREEVKIFDAKISSCIIGTVVCVSYRLEVQR